MELRDIEYFAVVAEHGHLGRAAETLQLSTPALSKSLRRLEAEAGTKLVRRTSRGVELTTAGSALLSHVRRLRLAANDVSAELMHIAGGRVGHLRLGANQFAISYLLPAACAALAKDAPRATLKILSGGNDVLVPALRDGQLDLIIGFLPHVPDDLAEVELLTDRFVVHASASHRLAGLKRVTIEDVARERWALGPASVPDWQWLHRAFELAGLPAPDIAMETSATPLRLRAVASSDLLGFAPRRLVKQVADPLRLVELPAKDLTWPCRLALRYRKEAYLSPVAKRFIEILKTAAREAAGENYRFGTR